MCLSCHLTSYLGNSTKILVIFFFKEKQHDQTDKVMYFMNNTLLKAFNLCYIPHNHNLQCLLKQWLSTKHLESLSILSLSSLHQKSGLLNFVVLKPLAHKREKGTQERKKNSNLELKSEGKNDLRHNFKTIFFVKLPYDTGLNFVEIVQNETITLLYMCGKLQPGTGPLFFRILFFVSLCYSL